MSGGRKSKQDIDHTIRDALRQPENSISNVIQATKQLRSDKVEAFAFKANARFEDIAFIYSVMDHYVSNSNWLPKIYSRAAGVNLEHFIIPDNRARQIQWYDGEQSFDISLEREFVAANKKKTVNLLVLDETLNGNIESYDIVTKIHMIKDWYTARGMNIPRHIATFIQHIESIPEYNSLFALRGAQTDQDTIKISYHAFLDVYFSEERQQTLLSSLQNNFVQAFQNHN